MKSQTGSGVEHSVQTVSEYATTVIQQRSSDTQRMIPDLRAMSHDGQTPPPNSRALKLLFSLADGLPTVGYGGGHQIVRGFARSLTRLGHEVQVVLGGPDAVGAAAEDLGVTYHSVGSESRWRFIPTGVTTVRLMASWRPDLVCCLTAELALVAPIGRLLRIPVITYIADPELLEVGVSLTGFRNARKHLGQAFQRPACFGVARVTTISEHTSRQAIDIWRLPARSVATVGTGLHEAYLQTPAESLERTPGAPLRLLSIGRIALAQKPLDVVARALHQTEVPWSHWTIIGTGAEADTHELVRTIEQLDLSKRVRMLGFKPPTDVVQELAQHDLVLLPSRHESFFMTPYEAIAGQRMVVTNDVAEVKHLLGESKLLILAAGQTVEAYKAALSAAWRRLEDFSPREQALAEQVRREYSWLNIADRFLEVAREVLRPPGSCPRDA